MNYLPGLDHSETPFAEKRQTAPISHQLLANLAGSRTTSEIDPRRLKIAILIKDDIPGRSSSTIRSAKRENAYIICYSYRTFHPNSPSSRLAGHHAPRRILATA